MNATTDVDACAAFVADRLNDDEVAARVCAETFPTPWYLSDRGHSATIKADAPNFRIVAAVDQDETPATWPGDALDHIALHAPDATLTRAAAQRALLDLHYDGNDGAYPDSPPFCAHCTYPYNEPIPMPCPTVRALAAQWPDHPDYQAGEWSL